MTESDNPDEAGIARVLRAAGGRDQPSEALTQHVREAVRAEWHAVVAQRWRRRRLGIGFAAAASIALAAWGLWASKSFVESPRGIVANVSRIEGSVSSREHSWAGSSFWQRWKALDARQSLTAGEDVMTAHDGRAALAFADGISLRLDRNTRVALVDAARIELLSGAVYVDAGAASVSARPLRIETPTGAVRHVGTQYEVRLLKPGLRIRVREGQVELLSAAGGAERVHSGEQLTVGAGGRLERTSIGAHGAQWAWVSDTAPVFDIEGRALRDFLVWVGRELGQEIVFASPESEAEAARATLHGSVNGLTPAEALKAVLSTTRLYGVQQKERILIELKRP